MIPLPPTLPAAPEAAYLLQPCPFCGERGSIENDAAHSYFVMCVSCMCSLGYEGGATETDENGRFLSQRHEFSPEVEAIAAWNTRVKP